MVSLCVKANEELEEFLNQGDINGNTCLHWAVMHSQKSVVSFLIENCGMDINQANFKGHTPLVVAIIQSKI